MLIAAGTMAKYIRHPQEYLNRLDDVSSPMVALLTGTTLESWGVDSVQCRRLRSLIVQNMVAMARNFDSKAAHLAMEGVR